MHNEPRKSWGDKEMGGEYALLFPGKISALNHHNALMCTYKHLLFENYPVVIPPDPR